MGPALRPLTGSRMHGRVALYPPGSLVYLSTVGDLGLYDIPTLFGPWRSRTRQVGRPSISPPVWICTRVGRQPATATVSFALRATATSGRPGPRGRIPPALNGSSHLQRAEPFQRNHR